MNIIQAIQELYNQWDGSTESAPIVLREINLLIHNTDIPCISAIKGIKKNIPNRVVIISDVTQPIP